MLPLEAQKAEARRVWRSLKDHVVAACAPLAALVDQFEAHGVALQTAGRIPIGPW